MNTRQLVNAACAAIRAQSPLQPELGLILGSGLGDFCDSLEERTEIPFSAVPGFPLPTVDGHRGAFVLGRSRGRTVLALRGRLHCYEGNTTQQAALPVRVMAALGIKTLILTNAAGGINLDYRPGDLMLLADHINFAGANPLTGPNLEEFGPRFPDMGDIYTRSLREKLRPLAAQAGLPLREGVYIMYGGPSYETPAEIRFFRTIGADAAGMSTVPEAIAARHSGMQVMGVSCITNMAAGILPQPLSHDEVVAAAAQAKGNFTRLLELMIDIG